MPSQELTNQSIWPMARSFVKYLCIAIRNTALPCIIKIQFVARNRPPELCRAATIEKGDSFGFERIA